MEKELESLRKKIVKTTKVAEELYDYYQTIEVKLQKKTKIPESEKIEIEVMYHTAYSDLLDRIQRLKVIYTQKNELFKAKTTQSIIDTVL